MGGPAAAPTTSGCLPERALTHGARARVGGVGRRGAVGARGQRRGREPRVTLGRVQVGGQDAAVKGHEQPVVVGALRARGRIGWRSGGNGGRHGAAQRPQRPQECRRNQQQDEQQEGLTLWPSKSPTKLMPAPYSQPGRVSGWPLPVAPAAGALPSSAGGKRRQAAHGVGRRVSQPAAAAPARQRASPVQQQAPARM